jgi:hypothetical protein
MQYLTMAEYLISLVGTIVGLIAKLKGQAAAAGATDAELDALDVRLTAAIAAREADQG